VKEGRSAIQPGEGGRPKFVVMLRNPVERTLSEYFWGRANWCLSYEHSQAWSPALCEVANDGQLKNSRGMEWEEQQVIDWLHSPYNLGLNRQVRSASIAGACLPQRSSFGLPFAREALARTGGLLVPHLASVLRAGSTAKPVSE
jgi:hypothetical protein